MGGERLPLTLSTVWLPYEGALASLCEGWARAASFPKRRVVDIIPHSHVLSPSRYNMVFLLVTLWGWHCWHCCHREAQPPPQGQGIAYWWFRSPSPDSRATTLINIVCKTDKRNVYPKQKGVADGLRQINILTVSCPNSTGSLLLS